MELLDRYLAAVRANLPAARAEDIIAELRGELLEQLDAREAALGRVLTPTEAGAMLKDFGRPIIVATRYRDKQQLIGPEVYPFYLYGLRVVAVVVLAVLLLSTAVPLVTGHGDFMRTLTRGLHRAEHVLLIAFAIVTLLFAVLERVVPPRAWRESWRPEALPAAARRKKSPWELPFDLGASLALLLWLLGLIPVSASYNGNGIHVEPGVVWLALYWIIVGLVTARIAVTLMEWLRPDWERLRTLLSMMLALGEIALLSRLAADGPWAIVTATTASAERAAQAGIGINAAIRIALAIALFAAGVRLIVGTYQLVMRRNANI